MILPDVRNCHESSVGRQWSGQSDSRLAVDVQFDIRAGKATDKEAALMLARKHPLRKRSFSYRADHRCKKRSSNVGFSPAIVRKTSSGTTSKLGPSLSRIPFTLLMSLYSLT